MLVNLKEIMSIANSKKIAIGSFNATGLDSIQAIIKAAEELNQPVILAHAEVHNIYNDIALLAPVMIDVAKRAKVPVCVHLDHGISMSMIKRAIDLGFTSIMVDASSKPFDENVRITKEVVDMCHAKNISVEAELGTMPSADNHNTTAKDFYTKPDEAKEFVKLTGCDALAISFGTAHGFYKSKPILDFDVIKNCAKSTNLPLVMHGGSGVSHEDYKKAIDAGIRKINYYSYMSKAAYEAAKKLMDSNKTSYFHDVVYVASNAMYEDVKKTIEIFSLLK